MILPDHEIGARVNSGSIRIVPWCPAALQPSSVDLRLGPILLLATPDGWREHRLDEAGPLYVYQHQFLLGATLEYVVVPPDLVAVLAGKSSIARQGLQVEAAGYVDPGWRGCLTLELHHTSPVPVHLSHGMHICQIRFEALVSAAARPYGAPGLGSRYQGSIGPTPSRAQHCEGGAS